ncbi:hypothetical protein BESB_000750 [Besnoitia besnoiti]|uniref:Anaphase-promoting complex subunit 4-like WD40 domain-containing protein n=1 Tax=Besnoitia besnoiti TaxID=94643 RepID=A0A2A9MP07_BESBE|nr:hypothetical protein BESB_000750 [Besnoitia besnoiti]PFH37733.1 hypothetical protein BESB_000750 [Besnoitia besnoiti]
MSSDPSRRDPASKLLEGGHLDPGWTSYCANASSSTVCLDSSHFDPAFWCGRTLMDDQSSVNDRLAARVHGVEKERMQACAGLAAAFLDLEGHFHLRRSRALQLGEEQLHLFSRLQRRQLQRDVREAEREGASADAHRAGTRDALRKGLANERRRHSQLGKPGRRPSSCRESGSVRGEDTVNACSSADAEKAFATPARGLLERSSGGGDTSCTCPAALGSRKEDICSIWKEDDEAASSNQGRPPTGPAREDHAVCGGAALERQGSSSPRSRFFLRGSSKAVEELCCDNTESPRSRGGRGDVSEEDDDLREAHSRVAESQTADGGLREGERKRLFAKPRCDFLSAFDAAGLRLGARQGSWDSLEKTLEQESENTSEWRALDASSHAGDQPAEAASPPAVSGRVALAETADTAWSSAGGLRHCGSALVSVSGSTASCAGAVGASCGDSAVAASQAPAAGAAVSRSKRVWMRSVAALTRRGKACEDELKPSAAANSSPSLLSSSPPTQEGRPGAPAAPPRPTARPPPAAGTDYAGLHPFPVVLKGGAAKTGKQPLASEVWCVRAVETGDRAAIWSIAISPAGDWLAVAGQTGVISLWVVPLASSPSASRARGARQECTKYKAERSSRRAERAPCPGTWRDGLEGSEACCREEPRRDRASPEPGVTRSPSGRCGDAQEGQPRGERRDDGLRHSDGDGQEDDRGGARRAHSPSSLNGAASLGLDREERRAEGQPPLLLLQSGSHASPCSPLSSAASLPLEHVDSAASATPLSPSSSLASSCASLSSSGSSFASSSSSFVSSSSSTFTRSRSEERREARRFSAPLAAAWSTPSPRAAGAASAAALAPRGAAENASVSRTLSFLPAALSAFPPADRAASPVPEPRANRAAGARDVHATESPAATETGLAPPAPAAAAARESRESAAPADVFAAATRISVLSGASLLPSTPTRWLGANNSPTNLPSHTGEEAAACLSLGSPSRRTQSAEALAAPSRRDAAKDAPERERSEAGHPAQEGEKQRAPWFVNDRPNLCLTGHCAAIVQLVWAPSKTRALLLSASLDKTVRLWRPGKQPQAIAVLRCRDWPTSVAFHPIFTDVVFTGCLDATVQVWRLFPVSASQPLAPPRRGRRACGRSQPRLVFEARVVEYLKVTELVTAISLSPDGAVLAVGFRNGTIAFYDAQTLKFRYELDCKNRKGKFSKGRKVTSLEWQTNGLALCVTTNDSRIRIFKVADLSCAAKFKGHVNEQIMLRANYTNDSTGIVCGSENGWICYWAVPDPRSSLLEGERQFRGGVLSSKMPVPAAKRKPTNANAVSFKAFTELLTCSLVAPACFSASLAAHLSVHPLAPPLARQPTSHHLAALRRLTFRSESLTLRSRLLSFAGGPKAPPQNFDEKPRPSCSVTESLAPQSAFLPSPLVAPRHPSRAASPASRDGVEDEGASRPFEVRGQDGATRTFFRGISLGKLRHSSPPTGDDRRKACGSASAGLAAEGEERDASPRRPSSVSWKARGAEEETREASERGDDAGHASSSASSASPTSLSLLRADSTPADSLAAALGEQVARAEERRARGAHAEERERYFQVEDELHISLPPAVYQAECERRSSVPSARLVVLAGSHHGKLRIFVNFGKELRNP